MEMPTLGPDHERLKTFVGEWSGVEKMYPTPWLPEGGMRDARISNRLALDGFAVVQDYVQLEGGKPTFRGHAVIMKNPHAPSVQMYWFDSFSPSIFEGEWRGDAISMVSRSPMGQTRASFDFSREGAYSFRMEMSQDGAMWSPMMDGEYSKV